VALVQRRARTLVLHEQLDETPEARNRACVSEVMPQLGLGTEADAVLASQPQAQVHVLAGRVRKPLVERKLLCCIRLHAEVQRRHVPEFSPFREQPLAGQGAVDLVVTVQERGSPGVGHASYGGKVGVRQEAGHVTMPITVEDAIMVCEEKELVTGGQCLGDGDISCPRGPAVGRQDHVLHVAIGQRVFQRARVIHNVDAREPRGLITHAIEQPK